MTSIINKGGKDGKDRPDAENGRSKLRRIPTDSKRESAHPHPPGIGPQTPENPLGQWTLETLKIDMVRALGSQHAQCEMSTRALILDNIGFMY